MPRAFNGTDQYLRATEAIVTAVPVSVSLWFYPLTLGADEAFFSIAISTGSSRVQLLRNASDQITASTVNSAGGSSGATTTATFTKARWHHAAGVWVGASERYAYLDGANKATNTASRTWSSGSDRMSIAARLNSDVASQFFGGSIARVALYNVALSDAEVFALSRPQTRVQSIRGSNLVGYWELEGFDPIEVNRAA